MVTAAPTYDRRAAENIVRHAYRDVLGREADADGLRNYRDKIMHDGWTEERLHAQLQRSGAFRSLEPRPDDRARLSRHLGREPDPDGLEHYRRLLKEGWTESRLRADLLRSDERRDTSVFAAINHAYREVLGRDPDPDGLAHYTELATDKAWTEQQIRNDRRNSAEYCQKHPRN